MTVRSTVMAVVFAGCVVLAGSPAAFGVGRMTPVPGAAIAAKGGLSSRELSDFQAFGTGNPGVWQFIADEGTGRVQDVFGAATARYKGSPRAAAADFLADNEALVNARSADLREIGFSTGKVASHVLYRQYYKGVPVEGAVIQVHIDGQGRVFWVQTLADPGVSLTSTRARISTADAEDFAARAARLPALPAAHLPTALVILPGEGGDRLTYKVRFHTDAPPGDRVYFVDALDGEIVAARDELMDAAGTVHAMVLENNSGPARVSQDMANEYVTVGGVRATTGATGAYTSSGSGAVAAAMTGPYARVVNEDQDGLSRSSTTSSWTWDFATSDSRFDEVNVFFHMGRIHDYFKTTFGIDQMDFEMTATVHFGDDYPNAYYSPQEEALSFGDGDGESARDSAQAAEVIYHEYGHATHDHVYARLGEAGMYTTQLRSLGEAWADYFSQVLTNDDEFGEWWIIEPAQRRPLVNTKTYPIDMQGEEHADGPIFAGALWDYRTAVGGTIADKTVAASWEYRPIDFRSALVAMLQADDELYGDMDLSNGTPHKTQIEQAFSAHGITTSLGEALAPLVFARNTTVPGFPIPLPVLYQAAANGTGARMIPTTAGFDWPDWNEAQRVIVASGNDALGNKVIYGIDPLTGVRGQLTGNLGGSGRVLAMYPSLSPQADKVCFSWGYQGQATMNLSVADVGTMDPMKPMGTAVPGVHAMDAGANEWYPDWSKANDRIVFAEMEGPLIDKSKAGLWVVNPNGTGRTQVTHTSGFSIGGDGTMWTQADYYPKWSRAGDKIAYVRLYTGIPVLGPALYFCDYHVYVMSADGHDAPGTLVLDGHSAFPATVEVWAGQGLGDLSWSPAGDALMFGVAGGDNGWGGPTTFDLYRIGTNGTGLVRVTTDGGTATSSWGAVDTSPPEVAGVQIQAPIDDLDRLTFAVDAADAQSGVYNCQYAIGTSPGGTQVRLWTAVSGTLDQFTATHLALVVGQTYYVTVKAKNGHGYVSGPSFSAGVSASGPPPEPDTIAPHTGSDRAAYYANSATIVLTPTDEPGGSGVARTYYELGGASQIESSTVSVSGAGVYTLVYWSVDVAGNPEEPHMVSFTVITPPSTGGTPSTPTVSSASVKHGKSYTYSGYLIKHTAGTYPVTLQFYRYQSGRWVLRKSTTAKASTVLTFSKYSDATSVPYSGKWRVRARHKVGTKYRYSGYRTFTAS